ncbi:MAG: hypothetical protein U0414_35915 [Polyangiaceae bacterium]
MASFLGLFGRVDVSLTFARDHVLPGESLHVIIGVESKAHRACSGLVLTLSGVETVSGEARPIVHEVRRLDGRPLQSNRKEVFQATFPIPADAPPTYASARSRIAYEVVAEVRVARAFDRRVTRPLTVGTRPPARARGTAGRGESSKSDAAGVVIQGRLASTDVEVGERVRGSFTLLNSTPILGVEAALVSTEVLGEPASAPIVVHHETHRLRVDTREARGPIPFGFETAAECPPSFVARRLRVESRVEIRVTTELGASILERPIVVHSVGSLSELRAAQESSMVPTADWSKALSAAGQGVTIEAVDDEAGEATISVDGLPIRFQTRVRRGGPLGLLASIGWGDLGLRFELEERYRDRGQREATRGFDDRFRVSAREPAQLDALLSDQGLRGALLACASASADDHCAMYDDDGTGYLGPPELTQFISCSVQLQRAMMRASTKIIPPRVFASVFRAWAAFAERHQAVLRPGDMAIRGVALGGARFDVVHSFEGDVPSSTTIRAPLVARAFDSGTGGPAPAIVESVRDVAEARVERDRDALVVHVPPVEHPSTIEATLANLADALRRIGPGDQSPYR